MKWSNARVSASSKLEGQTLQSTISEVPEAMQKFAHRTFTCVKSMLTVRQKLSLYLQRVGYSIVSHQKTSVVSIVCLFKGRPGAQNEEDLELEELPGSIQVTQSLVSSLFERHLDILNTRILIKSLLAFTMNDMCDRKCSKCADRLYSAYPSVMDPTSAVITCSPQRNWPMYLFQLNIVNVTSYFPVMVIPKCADLINNADLINKSSVDAAKALLHTTVQNEHEI